MKKYAVLGTPIKHSKSPAIHTFFSHQTGIELNYEAIEVQPENFSKTVSQLITQNYCGFNITLPLKGLAFEACDYLSKRAKLAQAVNTISIKLVNNHYQIHGDNTDGIGIVSQILNLQTIADKKVLILGAGGAVQGILYPILKENPHSITIVNRTPLKAVNLCEQFISYFSNIKGLSFKELAFENDFDIIINGTASSLEKEIPPISEHNVHENSLVIDMMYSKNSTVFCQWAKARTAHVYDGRGMLIEQAAHAFYYWTNIMPKTEKLYLKFNHL